MGTNQSPATSPRPLDDLLDMLGSALMDMHNPVRSQSQRRQADKDYDEIRAAIKALVARSETQRTEWEGYPGIAHDLETMRTVLGKALSLLQTGSTVGYGNIDEEYYERLEDEIKAALVVQSAIKRTEFDLEGNLLEVLRLADELTCAVDCEAEDIGGQRPTGVILRELGPAVDAANDAVKKAEKEIARG